MAKIIVPLLMLALSGCATSHDGDLEYDRADELAVARESFEKRAAACRNAGGSIRMEAKATKLQRPRYTAEDYRMAYCR